MHSRDDLNCNRGYEWWLLEEARKRNPMIITDVLSWAVPKWVGNDTFYSDDNIEYHVKWLECARDYHPSIGNVDFIGLWNERSWENNTAYVKNLRASLDAAGFEDTKIIMPDGFGSDSVDGVLSYIDADADFADALSGGGLGWHYPCDFEPHPEIQSEYGLMYTSSEDWSTVSDWDGAGCWGRILNQNMVRMNMTQTIAWSLIWSVYGECDGLDWIVLNASESNLPLKPPPQITKALTNHTAPHRTAPHRTAPHRTAPHRTAPHRTAPLL